ncbi:MAG: restriction endonuclease subunit S, partial [Hyphomicrobiaceae bacterium]
RFLYYALQGPGFAGPMGRIAGAGSTRAYIGITKQRELPIGYPCFEEQVRIADRLDALSEAARQLENIHERKVEALDALKKSLLHEAFAGNL